MSQQIGFTPSFYSGTDNDYAIYNSEFEKQSEIGRATGKMKSSKMLREEIVRFYSEDPTKIERVFVGKDEKGNLYQQTLSKSQDDVLG